MQQAINSVLKECTQNRLLALAVKSKLENEMIVHQAEDAEEASADTEEAEELPWADAVQEAQAQEEQEAQEELWLQGAEQ